MNAIVVGCLFVVSFVSAAKLPPYITPCRRSAIDLNECAQRNGQSAIPMLVRGDKSFKIPNMLPLKINHVEFDASRTLKIVMKNAEISGLEDTQIKDVKIDINQQHLKFAVFIPRANLLGEYDIKGRILILPIQGQGPCNITLIGGTFTYDVQYDIITKKGEKYLDIKKSEIYYDSQRTYFRLENLFNGDKRLGDEMNRFLNENWKDVSKDIGPALTETISQIITQIFSTILKRVPYDDLLPE